MSDSLSIPRAGMTSKEIRRRRRAEHRASQVAYPWRSALGAGVATLTAVLVAVAAVSPLVGPFVDRYVPGAGAGVVGFGVFCGGLAVLLKRIANLPAVTDLLVRLGIGPIPKS
jgi:hypothetical protein